MKNILVEDKKILTILNDKKELAEINMDLLKDMKEIEDCYKKNITRIKRADEKVRGKIVKLMKEVDLGEFEELSRVFVKENGQWFLEIVDRLEEFKNNFKNKKNVKSKDNNR